MCGVSSTRFFSIVESVKSINETNSCQIHRKEKPFASDSQRIAMNYSAKNICAHLNIIL